MLVSIKKGAEFKLGGKSYVVEMIHTSMVEQQIRFRDVESANEITKRMEDFLSLQESGELVFVKQNSGREDGSAADSHNILLLTDAQRKMIQRKRGFIGAITGPDGHTVSGTLELTRRIAAHKRATNDCIKGPSVNTVKRWSTQLSLRNGDGLSLLRRKAVKKVVRGEFGEVLPFASKKEELFDACVREYYLKPENEALARVKEVMEQKVKEDPYFENVVVPSKSTLYRWLSDMPEYEKLKLKKGFLEAQRNFPSGYIREHPTYLLESVELDHTQLDIVVADKETGEPIKNPWLTLMIDRKSRMIVGFYVAMHTPNIESVIHTFRNAVLGKGYVKKKYGEKIKTPWPCYGVMDQIITDNGAELHANDVRDVFGRYLDVQYNKKGTPQNKGTVERMFRTLNEGLIHGLEGTTFNSYVTKSNEYKSADKAVWTLEALIEALHIWIIDIYHNTLHSGINNTPLRYWNENQHMFQARTVANIDEIDQLLWKRESRKVQKYGIQLNNLIYQSPSLMSLAREHGMKLKVNMVWDKYDLSLIKVFVPGTEETIDVHCTEPRYVEGRLTLSEHNEIQSSLKEEINGFKNQTESIKLQARESIRNKALEEKIATTKAKRRANAVKRASNSVEVTGTQVSPISNNSEAKRDLDQNSGFDDIQAMELENRQEEK